MICPVAHESEAGACTCNSSHTTAGHGLHRCMESMARAVALGPRRACGVSCCLFVWCYVLALL